MKDAGNAQENRKNYLEKKNESKLNGNKIWLYVHKIQIFIRKLFVMLSIILTYAYYYLVSNVECKMICTLHSFSKRQFTEV